MEQDMNAERRGRRRYALVMAYVPWQEWGAMYGEDRGFERGTVFPALYYPFDGNEVSES